MILEPDPADPRKLPDAVFPNNWFWTEHDGTIIIYPMKAPNRRAERRRRRSGGPFYAPRPPSRRADRPDRPRKRERGVPRREPARW